VLRRKKDLTAVHDEPSILARDGLRGRCDIRTPPRLPQRPDNHAAR
jgi:hypothetical protein